MTFDLIKSRLTGLSCPVFGLSWNPPESDRTVARRLLRFFEDRRVLYNPSEMEVRKHCVLSVLEIRDKSTSELESLNSEDLIGPIRALRAACRKFLNSVGDPDDEIVRFGAHRNHYASWEFNGALGELRGVFGVHVAQLAAKYGLDVEDDLSKILPGEEDCQ